jgi:hypothetical protein
MVRVNGYSDNVSGALPTSAVVLPNCVHRPVHQVGISIQCIRWPGPYDPQERFRDIAVLPKGWASTTGGALARHRLVSAASSSEPPASVGLACRPVGAWRRQSREANQF